MHDALNNKYLTSVWIIYIYNNYQIDLSSLIVYIIHIRDEVYDML